jgi:hypothetical protein
MRPEEIEHIISDRTDCISDSLVQRARFEERKEFAEQVEKGFGYTRLKSALELEKINVPADVVLLKALTSLGIRPLARDSVRKYQISKARNMPNLITKALGIPMMISGVVMIIGYFIASMSSPHFASANRFPWGVVFGIGCFFTWVEHAIIPRRQWEIRDIQRSGFLSSRSSLIPREVFELALRVQRAVPRAQFLIHELEKYYGSWIAWIPDLGGLVRGDPDPFLEVRYGGESYFIAVWDEPGFDGKMMVVE